MAPASGGPAETAVAPHAAAARVPEVGGVDAAAGGGSELRGDLVAGAGRVDLLRRPERGAAVGRHRRERPHAAGRGRVPGHRHAPTRRHDAGRGRADEAAHEPVPPCASPRTTLGPTAPAPATAVVDAARRRRRDRRSPSRSAASAWRRCGTRRRRVRRSRRRARGCVGVPSRRAARRVAARSTSCRRCRSTAARSCELSGVPPQPPVGQVAARCTPRRRGPLARIDRDRRLDQLARGRADADRQAAGRTLSTAVATSPRRRSPLLVVQRLPPELPISTANFAGPAHAPRDVGLAGGSRARVRRATPGPVQPADQAVVAAAAVRGYVRRDGAVVGHDGRARRRGGVDAIAGLCWIGRAASAVQARSRAMRPPSAGADTSSTAAAPTTSTSTWVSRRIKSKGPARAVMIPRCRNREGRAATIKRPMPADPAFAPVPAEPDHVALEHRVLERWERERHVRAAARSRTRAGRRSRSSTGRSRPTTRWACTTPGGGR